MTEPASEPTGSRRRWLVVSALAAGLIALLATSLVLSRRSTSPTVDPTAIAIGKQEAINFFSLEPAHIEANINAVLALAANPFKQQYAAKAAAIKAGVSGKSVTVTASVPADSAGLEYENGNNAIVLVAVDETMTSAGSPAQNNRYRVRLHLTKVSGTWRVTQVQQVG